MNAAKQRVSLRVGDVLGPGSAPDLDENTRSDPPELNPNYWGEVVVLVVVGEVVARESLPRGVVDGSQPLFVGKCFSLTSQPDHSQLRTPLCVHSSTAMFFPCLCDFLFEGFRPRQVFLPHKSTRQFSVE